MSWYHEIWDLMTMRETRKLNRAHRTIMERKEAAMILLAEDQARSEDRVVRSAEAGAVVGPMDKMGDDGLMNPHSLIQTKTLAIVDEMMRDEAVGTFVEMKKAGALSVNWKIEPALADDDKAIEIADCTQAAYDNLRGSMVEAMHDQLSAIEFGYSAANVVLELMDAGSFKGKVGLKHLKTKPPYNIRFDTDEYLNILPDGVLFIGSEMMKPERMPRDEFAIYTYRKRFDDPYGYGDCIRAYDRWNSKKWINKFWDIYLERHATGTIFAQYSAEDNPSEQEHAVVWDFLQRKQVRSGLKTSDRWKFEVHEPGSSTSDIFDKAIAQRNTAIARAMLLPDLLGFSGKSGGTYALGKKHFDVFLWILLRIHKDLSEVHGEQIIRRIVDTNYGPQEAYPKLVFEQLTDDQKLQWLTSVVTAIEKGAISHDLEIENAIRAQLELAEKEEDEEKTAGGSPPGPTPDDSPPDATVDPEAAADEPSGEFQSSDPAKLNRRLTVYERKMNFQEMVPFINESEDELVDRWAELMQTNLSKLVKWLRQSQIIQRQDYAGAQKAKMSESLAQRKVMQRFLLNGCYFGSLQGQREIERMQKRSMALHRDDAMQFAGGLDIPISEIEQVFADKGLVTTQKITKAAMKAKADGFFITSVENEKVLAQAKQIMMRGIKRGDQAWTEGQLKRMFNKYLKSGEVTDAKLGQEWRVRQLARENFNRAMNEGRRAYFTDPEIEDFIVAYQWSSIMDDGTTDYCASMDERILRKEELDSEGWPPAHYGCRSMVIAVTDGEKFKFDKIPKGLDRATGFAACC